MSPNATQKYLANYAEQEIKSLGDIAQAITHPFTHTVVIPAYQESAAFIQRLLQTQWPATNVLVIVVINTPDTANSNHTEAQLYTAIAGLSDLLWTNNNLSLLAPRTGPVSFLCVDRFQPARRIPAKQGVGLARKIGVDIAIALRAKGLLEDDWIFSTDADAQLAPNYFSLGNLRNQLDNKHSPKATHYSAVTLPFQHRCDHSPVGQATALYEQALHYYVRALHWAGSPYAFHTIGSCLCIYADDYCKVRGFPKRAAGEDFYLLNKLNKLAPVLSLTAAEFNAEPALRLQARVSERVPFGTGPSVQKIINLTRENKPYTYYNAHIFPELKQLLSQFNGIKATFTREEFCQTLPLSTQQALQAISIDTLFIHLEKLITEGKPRTVLRKHSHDWFDAFKTLKFVHYLEAHFFPATPLSESLRTFAALSTRC